MQGWGVLLVLLGLGSFVLPALGMQFRLIQLFGNGDPRSAGVMFIIVGAALYTIGSAVERRRRRAVAQRTQATPPAAVQPAPPPPLAPTPAPPAATGMNFCGNCGTRVTKAGKFCTSCGAPL